MRRSKPTCRSCAGWKYPTDDSPKIRVRDLLTHTAGFVTDDPVGRPADAAARRGVHASSAATACHSRGRRRWRWSTRTSATPCSAASSPTSPGSPTRTSSRACCSRPSGMAATGYDVAAAPRERRALGYRWEDNAWKLEPTMAHGAFGAMGGIQTSATDYARWVSYLLSAWPPRDGADSGPVRRSSVRELAQGANFPSVCGCGRDRVAPTRAARRRLTAWVSTRRPTASSASP